MPFSLPQSRACWVCESSGCAAGNGAPRTFPGSSQACPRAFLCSFAGSSHKRGGWLTQVVIAQGTRPDIIAKWGWSFAFSLRVSKVTEQGTCFRATEKTCTFFFCFSYKIGGSHGFLFSTEFPPFAQELTRIRSSSFDLHDLKFCTFNGVWIDVSDP